MNRIASISSLVSIFFILHFFLVSYNQVNYAYVNVEDPHMFLVGKNIYLIWTDYHDNHTEVLFRRSSDNGSSWSHYFNISNSTVGGGLGCPEIAAAGDNVYVVWSTDKGILFRKGYDHGGLKFGNIKLLSNSTSDGGLGCPKIAAAGDNVYVVWSHKIEQEVGEIMFRASSDSGKTFGRIIPINNGGGYGSFDLSTDGDNAYVAWDDYGTSDTSDIYFRKIQEKGNAPENIVQLIKSTVASRKPEIGADGNKLFVLWRENNPTGSNMLLSSSTDHGESWTKPVTIN